MRIVDRTRNNLGSCKVISKLFDLKCASISRCSLPASACLHRVFECVVSLKSIRIHVTVSYYWLYEFMSVWDWGGSGGWGGGAAAYGGVRTRC